MKVSRRIMQFLLVLLKYEKVDIDKSRSPLHGSPLYQLQYVFYRRTHGLVPDEFGHFKVGNALKNSFNRTIHIMLRQGLISEGSWWGEIMLTEKGRKMAVALEKEVRKYIEDFSFC